MFRNREQMEQTKAKHEERIAEDVEARSGADKDRLNAFISGAPPSGWDASMADKKTVAGITEIDTEECEPWNYHNRTASWKAGSDKETLIRSMRELGQLEPGLVIDKEREGRYQIVYGARRWDCCIDLGIPFLAKIAPANTPVHIAMKMMFDENEQSRNVSELENGIVFRALINDKQYASQTDLADSLGVTKQYVSKLCFAAELLDTEWAKELLEPVLRGVSIAMAKEIKSYAADLRLERKIKTAVEENQFQNCVAAKDILKTIREICEKKKRDRSFVLSVAGKKIGKVQISEKGLLKIEADGGGLDQEGKAELMRSIETVLTERFK